MEAQIIEQALRNVGLEHLETQLLGCEKDKL